MLSRKTIVFLALLLALLLAGQWFGERHLADADGADPAGATLVPPAHGLGVPYEGEGLCDCLR